MGDMFSGQGGGAGDPSSFLSSFGTGFVNGRLGAGNPYTGYSPLSQLFTQTINANGAAGNAAAAANSPGAASPLLQSGVVPAPTVSAFGSPVPSTPNAQWGTQEWGTPQG